MSLLEFSKPELICIVDQGGSIVWLNDKNRTEMRFNASERRRVRNICEKLNALPGAKGRPFRLIPLIGE